MDTCRQTCSIGAEHESLFQAPSISGGSRADLISNERGDQGFALSPFFGLSQELLCIVDSDWFFKSINPICAQCFAKSTVDLLAQSFMELVHPDDCHAALVQAQDLANGAQSVAFETRFRVENDVYRWVRWQAQLGPEQRCIYVVGTDMSVRRQLEAEVVAAGDRERDRLARDLHDGLCQNLAGISALCGGLGKSLAAGGDLTEAVLLSAEIGELLGESIGEARDLTRRLYPTELEQWGLSAALDKLASNVGAWHQVSCRFDRDRLLVRLDLSVEAHLYRIAQEALNNAITHGRAEQIELSLHGLGDQACLCVRDNGVGLTKLAARASGIGLRSMKYRANLIGGVLDVESIQPRGTQVTCRFSVHMTPVPEECHVSQCN